VVTPPPPRMVQRGFEALLHATLGAHHLGPESVLVSACPPQCAAETKGVILDFGPGTGSFGMTARLAAGVMRATDVVFGAAPSLPGAPLPDPPHPYR
jgi:hypothetical protein